MKVKYKKLNSKAVDPVCSEDGQSEVCLYVSEKVVVAGQTVKNIKTGVALDVPSGYVGKIYDIRDVALEHTLSIKSGVLNTSTNGAEVCIVVSNTGPYPITLLPGDPIARVIFSKEYKFLLEDSASVREE